jgi:glycosyltransferase involved in cell wall biosynthesis
VTIDYFIPVIGQQNQLDECLLHLARNLDNFERTQIHVIDNGSDEPIYVDPHVRNFVRLHRQDKNLGMVESLIFAMRNSSADLLVYSHSDFLIYEAGWDTTLRTYFEADEKLGLIGVVGAAVAAENGGRGDVMCSFIDGYKHGEQTPVGVHPCALLDGCFMAFRRKALDAVGVDRTFKPHHFYDKDWSLNILFGLWRVGVMSLYCAHRGGQVSCRPEYQNWAKGVSAGGDQDFYFENERKYIDKWKHVLPVTVHPDWSVTAR